MINPINTAAKTATTLSVGQNIIKECTIKTGPVYLELTGDINAGSLLYQFFLLPLVFLDLSI